MLRIWTADKARMRLFICSMLAVDEDGWEVTALKLWSIGTSGG